MTNRLIKNYATTVLGIGIIAYCMYMMYKGTEWKELVGFYTTAGLLLRSKDSLLGLAPKDNKK